MNNVSEDTAAVAPNIDRLFPNGECKIIFTPEESKRFFSKVDFSSEQGCWLWKACTHKTKGYGHFRFRGKPRSAHKLSYEVHKGRVPRGLLVCHECDVRACVNPAHLWLGTNEDNVEDMVRKGRAADGSQVPNGERCYNAKITEEKVLEMRERYSKGDISQKSLGLIYGIQQMQVCRILRGERWRHLGLKPIKSPALRGRRTV